MLRSFFNCKTLAKTDKTRVCVERVFAVNMSDLSRAFRTDDDAAALSLCSTVLRHTHSRGVFDAHNVCTSSKTTPSTGCRLG